MGFLEQGDAVLPSIKANLPGKSPKGLNTEWKAEDLNLLRQALRDLRSFAQNAHDVVSMHGADPTGAADSQPAFQAAVNAAQSALVNGVVLVPAGKYKLDSGFSATGSFTMIGVPGATINSAQFGHASWQTLQEKGSVLLFTPTSGVCIDIASALFNISGIVIKGMAGGGSPTGLRVQGGAGTTFSLTNVATYNLGTGIDIQTNANSSSLVNINTRGCKVGLLFERDANANTVTGFNSSNDWVGLKLSNCNVNRISGGSIQNYSTYGVHVLGGAQNYVGSIYFESALSSNDIWIERDGGGSNGNGGYGNAFEYIHHNHLITCYGDRNTFVAPDSLASLSFLGTAAVNAVYGNVSGTFNDATGNNTWIKYRYGGPPEYVTGASAPNTPTLKQSGGPYQAHYFNTAGGLNFGIEVRDDLGYARIHDAAYNVDFLAMNANGGNPVIVIGPSWLWLVGGVLNLQTPLCLATPSLSQQSGQMYAGSGAPSNGDGTNNGTFYFRHDTPGTAGQRIYVKSGGSWVGIV
jgi:hypothetical protein